jgi:hypothetical protein
MAQYRDTHTGRYVSKETWSRSKLSGGSRYVRVQQREKEEEEEDEFDENEFEEFVLGADYGDAEDANVIYFQYHMTAPAGTSDETVAKVLNEFGIHGELPDGFNITEIYWGHKKPDKIIEPSLTNLARDAAAKGVTPE